MLGTHGGYVTTGVVTSKAATYLNSEGGDSPHSSQKGLAMSFTSFQTQPLGLFAAIGSFFRSIFSGLEYAGMTRALLRMSDAELAQIGITRRDIPAHAGQLVSDKDH